MALAKIAGFGKIRAIAPEDMADAGGGAGGVGGGAADQTDQTLPDPTHSAVVWLGIMLVIAAAIAVVFNLAHWTGKPFQPAKDTTANFSLFAGFYVAAQVIERMMQLVTPFLPWWNIPSDPTDTKGTAKAAQIKADRTTAALGIAAVLGVAGSCGFGLFFLAAIGIHTTHTIDAFLTGITIAAGTKPLHDFITLLQNQNAPKTGTGTT